VRLGKPAPSQPAQTLPWGIKRVGADNHGLKAREMGLRSQFVDTGIDYTHKDLDAKM